MLDRAETLQVTRQLMGRAIATPAPVFYEAIGHPTLRDLDRAVALHIDPDGSSQAMNTSEDAAKIYFIAGLGQAAEFIGSLASVHPNIDEEAFQRIATHPRSIQALAYLASQSELQADGLRNNPGLINNLSGDQSHVILTDYARIRVESRNGPCPVVHYDPETDTVDPEPIFYRFSEWAGQVGVRAYFAHAR